MDFCPNCLNSKPPGKKYTCGAGSQFRLVDAGEFAGGAETVVTAEGSGGG